MIVLSTCSVDMQRKVATVKTQKVLLKKSNEELFASARGNEVRSTQSKNILVKRILQNI